MKILNNCDLNRISGGRTYCISLDPETGDIKRTSQTGVNSGSVNTPEAVEYWRHYRVSMPG